MSARNFGIPSVTARPAVGGFDQPSGPHYSADTTRADSNIIQFAGHTLPPTGRSNSEPSNAPSFIPDPAKQDMQAFWFALGAFTSPFIIVGCLITGWLLFS